MSPTSPSLRWIVRSCVGVGLLSLVACSSAIERPSQPRADNPSAAESFPSPSHDVENPIFDLSDELSAPSERSNYGLNFIADAAERAAPAVVQLQTARRIAVNPDNSAPRTPFRRFLDDFLPEPGPRRPNERDPERSPRGRGFEQRGSGSGFIVSEAGMVVTNAHVVNNADVVRATLADGREYAGRVIGRDPLTDLAVVQLETDEPLPAIGFGDSGLLRPGEWVVALGSPLGLSNSVTAGIVSALGRTSQEIRVGDRRIDFIQTDAAINPGNSGGPLINIDGEVVGINTAIIRGAEGIGFAIPVNEAQIILDQLLSNGKVVRSYVGVRMNTLSPEVVEQLQQRDLSFNFDETVTSGVLIVDVVAKSPAAAAGLQGGDIIIGLNGEAVTEASQMQGAISGLPVGTEVTLSINRNGREREVVLKTAELTQQFS
ncbi:trypsin-like peptidase domain-containing protein [Synechococcus sp. PCC 7336]|uniref:trypsin-like peptidase domain-containing protein n=1 Tax=Synechococcus sp. PCC 7336 TaxID=195250 RepID=UPI000346350A|nr:trypsin-like peptidase domain-containing protein [Synechococcus sp. PCC 7336]